MFIYLFLNDLLLETLISLLYGSGWVWNWITLWTYQTYFWIGNIIYGYLLIKNWRENKFICLGVHSRKSYVLKIIINCYYWEKRGLVKMILKKSLISFKESKEVVKERPKCLKLSNIVNRLQQTLFLPFLLLPMLMYWNLCI